MAIRKLIGNWFLAFAATLFSLQGISQNSLELLKLEYANYPGNNLEDQNGNTFNAVSKIFDASYRVPVFITGKWKVLGSVQFKNFQVNQDEYAFLKNISGAGVNFTAFRKGEKWSYYFASEINYGSDRWNNFAIGDLILRGSGGIISLGEGAVKMIGFGVGASSDFGVPTVLPMFFFRLKINERMHFEAILPLKSRISYTMSPDTYIGFQHFIHYSAFAVSNEYRTEDLKFGKIRSMNGALFCEQRVHKNIWLTANGGLLFKNVIYLYDEKRKETNKLAANINYFLNLKLAVKINRNEYEIK